MQKAILFKILQRRFKFRNPHHWVQIPDDFIYTQDEYRSAKAYIEMLAKRGIAFSYPECPYYPPAFLRMKEPPLFFEYLGEPIWLSLDLLSVVGARDVQVVSEQWMRLHLGPFMEEKKVGIVSGGANGVDQFAHLTAIKNNVPTIVVLPSGLMQMYPRSLQVLLREQKNKVCFLSEFEVNQPVHKAHFYFRNRLIAALGLFTLVVQSSLRSGSMLTVHHCLEVGRPVATVPAHPQMAGFEGNIKLLQEGAFLVRGFDDLRDFWKAELQSNQSLFGGSRHK
ncbi:DNA processing protein DprA [Pseudobdellovibrio exovorus]|uniref:Smf family DNA processing protein n=1 Tax=Pseudobdellovibrio exovorus JSS TaxID=1184267 RepID=M4VAZ0_9BACT|nr:DNA processing protein DprA [Pseudobdellovibrio exovorus]AGH95191.1 Smf family DNA processing protein [Pseudobdellovibrio exovorus JSS]